jgi:hypothetical protein
MYSCLCLINHEKGNVSLGKVTCICLPCDEGIKRISVSGQLSCPRESKKKMKKVHLGPTFLPPTLAFSLRGKFLTSNFTNVAQGKEQ